MLSIDINQNIDDYKESVIAGFDARQTLYLILSLISMGGMMLFFSLIVKIPLIVSVYLSMPFAVPFILTGFF